MVQEVAPPLCEGRYRLIGELGVGGMATVYRAYDSRLQVERAIKVLAPHLAARSSIRKRFEVEASTMARLHHPNIVTVHDIGSDGNRCFIVMELLEGGSLMGRVERHGVLPPRMAAAITADMVEALGIAHAKGVVHRDIKPHNVLLNTDNKPKVTDFGIASVQQEDRSMTKTGAVMGTWAYMAPEQRIDAKNVDERADLYSSAASLYALLTGREPFDLYTTELHEEMFKDIPDALADVIKKGCAYKAEDRHQNAQELTEALRAILPDLPEDPENTPPLALPTDPSRPAFSGDTLSPASFPDFSESGRSSSAPTTAPPSAAAGGATFDGSLWLAEEEDAPPPVMPAGTSQPPTTASGTMEPPITLTPGMTQPETNRAQQSMVGILLALLIAAGSLWYVTQQPEPPQSPGGVSAADLQALRAEMAGIQENEAERQRLQEELEKLTKQREEEAAKASSRKAVVSEPRAKKPTRPGPKSSPEPSKVSSTPAAAPEPPPPAPKPVVEAAKPAMKAAEATAPPPEVKATGGGEGELRMNSLPWSHMTIDGKPAGRTGKALKLKAGRHTVGLMTTDGRRHSVEVVIRAGQVVKICWDFDKSTKCER